MRAAVCHPDRANKGGGLCNSCWVTAYRKRRRRIRLCLDLLASMERGRGYGWEWCIGEDAERLEAALQEEVDRAQPGDGRKVPRAERWYASSA